MQRQTRPYHIRTFAFLLFWLGLLGLIVLNQQRMIDWWKLRGYEPPQAVADIVDAVRMNERGRHLFYVNKPQLLSGSAFSAQCPIAAEKTIILGCYKGGDRGIYLYYVTDERLRGVEEVTAAHEMLHAAYARLSNSERTRVDTMLQDYYTHSLTDQRVKDTIAAYRKTEPNQLANEMHSIFATEIAELTPGLESYYQKYFDDRAKVVGYATRYGNEFTSRRQQVNAYDTQLASLKQTIEANQTALKSQRTDLEAQQNRMEMLRNRGDIAEYNGQVASYNQAVNAYNSLLTQTRGAIAEYNDIVEKRNAVALEERELTQALSPQSLPASR